LNAARARVATASRSETPQRGGPLADTAGQSPRTQQQRRRRRRRQHQFSADHSDFLYERTGAMVSLKTETVARWRPRAASRQF